MIIYFYLDFTVIILGLTNNFIRPTIKNFNQQMQSSSRKFDDLILQNTEVDIKNCLLYYSKRINNEDLNR